MARTIETGVKYFPLDTGIFSDRKIRKLLLTFGAKGFLVYTFVLCEIYKDKGYFVQCDDDFLLDIAYTLNLPESTVSEIVNFCVSNVLFDKRVFDVEKALTSSGIQKRFSEIKKRSDIKILDCHKINVTEMPINVTEMPINDALIPQKKRKEKEIKVKEIKEVFENFRKKYQGSKNGFDTEFSNFKKHKDWEDVIGLLVPALENEINWREKGLKSGTFIPNWKNLKTWLHNRCWEQELNFEFKNQSNGASNRKTSFGGQLRCNRAGRLHSAIYAGGAGRKKRRTCGQFNSVIGY